MSLACCRLYARARRDTNDDDLSDVERLEGYREAGIGEGSPGAFGDEDVVWLLLELGDELGPAGGEVADAETLLGAAGGGRVYVDEDDG